MKKNLSKFRFVLLGIIMCLISMCAIGQTSRTYSYAFTSKVWSALGTQSIGGWTWTASGTSTGSYFGYDKTKEAQQFGSASAPFTALNLSTNSIKGTVTSVKVNTLGGNSVAATFEVKVGGTNLLVDTASTISVTNTATEYEFTGSAEAGTIELIWNQTSSKALYIKSIEVTYIPDPRFVDAPTFTPAAGNYYEPASVTLATVAEGATIYYTIDGTEPSTSSLLYQEPIAVEQTTTIKAIAVRDTNSSEVSTADYSFPIQVNSTAAFKQQGIEGSIYKLTSKVKVIYAYVASNPTKNCLFVQDQRGALILSGAYDIAKYNAGDEIKGGIFGKYKVNYGRNEMVFEAGAPALPEATAGTPVEAVVATIPEVKNNYTYSEGKLLTIKDVVAATDRTFGTTTATKELLVVNGEDSIFIYDNFSALTGLQIAEGQHMNVTGLIIRFNDKFEIAPRNTADIEFPAELPVVVDFDVNPAEGWVINNETGNNKWYIGQAQDFDNNKLYISSTNGLTNKYGESESRATFARYINIPAVGAKLTFEARVNGEEGSDYLSVVFKDQTLETFALNNEWENYTINIAPDMAGAGTLQFVWQNNGSVQNQFPAAVDNISITQAACAQVSNLNAAVDTTSATITWTALEDQTAWTLEYKLANHTEWYSVNATTPSVVLNNLQGNSNYDVRVKANCGEESSVWTNGTFAIDCQNKTFPLTNVTIGTGTGSSYYAPFNNYFHYSWNECIYPANTLPGAGTINSISWNCAATGALTFSSLKIYMGTRTSSTYANTSAWTPEKDLKLVYDGTNVVVGASTGWQEFVLNTPFNYNGTDNLVVVVSKKQSGYSNNLKYYYTSTSNTCLYRENDYNEDYAEYPGTNYGTRGAYRANIKVNIEGSCSDPVSCPDLVSVEANELTPNSATIEWTLAESSTQDNFVVEYKTRNSADWTTVQVQSTSVFLTDLTPLTTYDVKVKAVCGENNHSTVKTFEFRTLPTCLSVTNIENSNMSNTTTVTWEAGSNETEWNVQFKLKENEDENAWISLPLVQVLPTTTFGGLVGNTDYIIRIQPVCEGIADWTEKEFKSGCAAENVPYSITFGTDDATCWENNGFTASSSYYSTSQDGAEMISQALVIPTTGNYYVEFNVKGNYEIYASDRGTRADRFALLAEGYKNGKVILQIPDNYKGKTVNFKLVNGESENLYLYAMQVTACPYVPTSLTYDNLTYNSIDLAWTADAMATNFQVQYGEHGFIFGEGNIVDVQGNTTTINGLQGNTTYDFYVSTVCGSETTDAVALTNIKTLCMPLSLPYAEDFESYTPASDVSSTSGIVMPDCWTDNWTATASYSYNYCPKVTNDYSYQPSTGNYLYFNAGGSSYTYYQNPTVIVLPEFAESLNTAMISFRVRCSNTSYTTYGQLLLGYVDDNNQFTSLKTITCETAANAKLQTHDLSAYTFPQHAKLAFKADYTYYYTYYSFEVGIDDIAVELLPSCGTPSIAVSGVNATITRGAGISNPTAYDLQIENEIQRVNTTNVDLSTVFTLNPNTDYEVSVRAICSETDNSEWSEPVQFTTPCMALPVPYTQDFEGTTFPPECWTQEYVSGSHNWERSINTTYGSSSNCAAFTYVEEGTSTKLITPNFDLSASSSVLLSFKHSQVKWFSSQDKLTVYYRTSSSSSWVSLVEYTTNYTMTQENITLPPAALSATTQFAFEGYDSWGRGIYVDDFKIENEPTCGTPSISVSGTTATITPSTLVGTPQSYVLKIDNEQQTVPATDTTTIVDLGTIFSLELNTNYEVSVKSNCGETAGYSEWTAPVSFTTPACLGSYDVTIGTGTATSRELPSYVYYKYSLSEQIFTSTELGGAAGTIQSVSLKSISVATTRKMDIYLVHTDVSEFASTPSWIRPTSADKVYSGNVTFKSNEWTTIKFDQQFEYDGLSNVVLIIDDNTGSYNEDNKTFQTTLGSTYTSFYVYNDYTNLDPMTSTGGTRTNHRNNVIFNICPVPVVSCGKPRIVVDENAIATIIPHETGDASTFALQIDGINGQEIVHTTTVNLVDLFHLDANTAYSVSAKAICGEDDESEWTGLVSFKTPCTSYDLPYTQNFDSYTSSQTISSSIMPDCWNRLYTGNSEYYGVGIYPDGSYTTYSQSAPNSLRLYVYNYNNSSSYGDAYAVMPSFNTPNSVTKVSFYAKNYTSDRDANIEVGIVTDINDIPNTFTLVETVTPTSTSTYDLFSISLADYQVPEGNIAFRILKPTVNGYNGAYIDDIEITELPTLDLAVTAVSQPKDACEISSPLKVTVKNTGITDSIRTFTIGYQVNTNTPVIEVVNLTTALQPGDEYTYTFEDVVYLTGNVVTWVDLEGDGDLTNNSMTTEAIEVLDPITVPYEENFNDVVEGHGWNVTDLNNDGVTFTIDGKISYAYNDTENANDVVYSPCVELAPGKYNAYFDYNALSSMTESFDFIIKNNATGAITPLIIFEISGTEVDQANTVFEIAEAGVYEFGFLAKSNAGNMGFVIDNFKVYPVVEVEVAANENGVVSPNGKVEVNYGEDLVMSIMPNTMYHVGGITVDGELVQGEDASNANFMLFTLSNVTEPHNVYVDFKLEFHIIKSVANFNTEYTDVPGWFVPATTDTTNDVTPRTLTFFAAPHYHLYSLEEGLMSTENMTDVTDSVRDLGMVGETHKYSFTTDTLRIANYYYKATFRRDTVNIHYNVLTGKGYADDSQILAAGQSYDTWVDYSVVQDVNHTSTFAPYTTGETHSDYHIVDVTVDGQSQGVINEYTFTNITANHNVDIKYGYQVNATIRNYAVSSLGSTELRGTIAPAQQLVAEGDTTIVTGTIQENFHLYNLFVDGVDMINDVTIVEDSTTGGYKYTYTIDSTIANYNIEAVVKLDTVAIHYHIDGGQGYADFSGLLNEGDDYTTHINFGDSILSVVAPGPGYSIANYILEGFDMGAVESYQFNNVRKERFVHLNFVTNDIAIVTNAYGHGTVTNGMNFTYNPETPVNYNFVATPEEGYHITNVLINGEAQVIPLSGSFVREFTNVSENYTFDVYFDVNTYTMTATATGAGMINPVGVQTVAYGSNMNYVATANVGSYITSVVVDTTVNNYTQDDNLVTLNIPFNNIQANHNVTVSFAGKTFGIHAVVDENGHGFINMSREVVAVVNYGMGYVLDFTPDEGYHVSQILVDGEAVEVADSYQFVNVQENHDVVVSFAINQYTLTATSNVEACTITPTQTTANYGDTVVYTINVAEGYSLVNVMDNGSEVAVENNTFSIENVNANHVINANFEVNTYVVTVNQPDHAVITPGTQTVAYDATPSYVIVPQAGYEVVSVTAGNEVLDVTLDDNGVGYFTLSPVHANLEINAVVAQETYTISVLPSQGQGTVSPATNQTVTYGSNKTFTFAPATHYVIGDIIVDGVSKGALTSYTFVNVVANHTIQAVFEGACAVPTDLDVDNITSASAQLSWSNTGAESYTVRYQAVGETTYHETTSNTNSCTISGLAQDAIYYWSVKANCDAANESDYSYEMQFITEPANVCDEPTNLTVEEVYNENVKVSWTSNATTFNVRCKRQGDDPSTYVYTYGVNGTEYTFNYLLQATTYNWGVQAICNYATGNLSAWAESTFTTGSTGIASDELSSIRVYSHLNNVYVVNENGIAIKDVKIYDIYGKLVYSGNATSNPEVIALNVANGNYVVKLDTENGVAVYKLAIIR